MTREVSFPGGAMSYTFQDVARCNMCESPVSKSKILGKRMNRSQGVRPANKIGVTTTVMRCGVCRLVYSDPLPIPGSMSQHYGIPPESYWSEDYFTVDDKYFSSQINQFFTLYGLSKNLFALDIGAGVGKCITALERRGFTAYGIEPSKSFYQHALDSVGVQPGRLQMAPIEDADFPENMFDFATFGAVLEHLYDPSQSIRSAIRWVKPGGLIHIEVPSSAWLTNKIANLVYALQGLDYVSNISPMHSPFHLYEFSPKSFSHHAALYGYEIAHSQYQIASTFLPKILDSFVKPIMSVTNTGMQLEIWLRKK